MGRGHESQFVKFVESVMHGATDALKVQYITMCQAIVEFADRTATDDAARRKMVLSAQAFKRACRVRLPEYLEIISNMAGATQHQWNAACALVSMVRVPLPARSNKKTVLDAQPV